MAKSVSSTQMNNPDQILKQAKALLDDDKIVVIPTETVYGLGANATSDKAIEKIFKLKNRPSNNPLICHVADLAALLNWIAPDQVSLYEPYLQKLKVFWPGPLTVVVPKHPSISKLVSAGGDSVGLRIPSHPMTLALLKTLSYPLAAPSANRSNYISPTCAEHVKEELKDDCPFIIDGGNCDTGIESTVLSLLDVSKPKILRAGAITQENIESVLSAEVEIINTKDNASKENNIHISPGQLSIHYSPNTPMKFLHLTDLGLPMPARVGLISFSNDLALDFDFAAIEVLSKNNNLNEVAANLYGAMRNLDQLSLDLILVDKCDNAGIGAAIMDRLIRACR